MATCSCLSPHSYVYTGALEEEAWACIPLLLVKNKRLRRNREEHNFAMQTRYAARHC